MIYRKNQLQFKAADTRIMSDIPDALYPVYRDDPNKFWELSFSDWRQQAFVHNETKVWVTGFHVSNTLKFRGENSTRIEIVLLAEFCPLDTDVKYRNNFVISQSKSDMFRTHEVYKSEQDNVNNIGHKDVITKNADADQAARTVFQSIECNPSPENRKPGYMRKGTKADLEKEMLFEIMKIGSQVDRLRNFTTPLILR